MNRLYKKFKESTIIIYDLSYEMIKKAKYRFKNKNIFCINGSAELMSLPNNCIDLITLSFGLRNFSDIDSINSRMLSRFKIWREDLLFRIFAILQ